MNTLRYTKQGCYPNTAYTIGGVNRAAKRRITRKSLHRCKRSTVNAVPDTLPDIIIVGAGPSGISLAYWYNLKYPKKKIILLERSPYTLKEYENKNYGLVKEWVKAGGDPDNIDTISSKDGKQNLTMGRGLGGGTLHFGLQYIDNVPIESEFAKYIDDINNMMGLQKYDYSSENGTNKFMYNLHSYFKDKNLNVFNNKIYSRDLYNRFSIGKLVQNNPNIQILYDVEIDYINIDDNNNVVKLECTRGRVYRAKQYVLSAGAIYSPIILQKSNILTGNYIRDHGGVTLYYQHKDYDMSNEKLEYILGHIQLRADDYSWQIYLSTVPDVPYLIVTYATSYKISTQGYVKVKNNKPVIDINYGDAAQYIYDAYNKIDPILAEYGFYEISTGSIPGQRYTKEKLSNMIQTIYHYHSTNLDIVNSKYKVNEVNNLYICDLSVYKYPAIGSTSINGLLLGRKLVDYL